MDDDTKQQIIDAVENEEFDHAAQNTIGFGDITAILVKGVNPLGSFENQPWTITWYGNGQSGTISRDTNRRIIIRDKNGNIIGGRRRRRRTRRSRGSKKRSSRRHRRSRRHH